MFPVLLVQNNLWDLICVGMIAGANTGCTRGTQSISPIAGDASLGDMQIPVVYADGKVCHKIWYNPLYGATNIFLFLYHDISEPIPSWYYSWTWYFEKTAWVDALLWVFLVVPITVFTYWLYEPICLERYRFQFYTFLLQKCCRSQDSEAKDSEATSLGGWKIRFRCWRGECGGEKILRVVRIYAGCGWDETIWSASQADFDDQKHLRFLKKVSCHPVR